LDQHQLTGHDPELLGRLLGGGHGHHQIVAGDQHARGDPLKARQRLLQLFTGGLPGGQRFQLVSQMRPFLVELGQARFDFRGRRPQTQGRPRRIQVLQQLAGVAVPLPQKLQRDVRVTGGARRHARHLQRQQHLLLEPRKEVRVVPGPALLVEIRADGQGEQDRR
jgi:hypothetical protein